MSPTHRSTTTRSGRESDRPVRSKEKPSFAVVESVGPEVKSVKKNDKIIYKEYSTTSVKIDDVDYIILDEKDILATL